MAKRGRPPGRPRTSARKADAARANGQLGGRPPKAGVHTLRLSDREIRQVAADLTFLCGQLGLMRLRLVELEAHGRMTVVKIRALAEGQRQPEAT